jgi:flagellar M-ring protein FliF
MDNVTLKSETNPLAAMMQNAAMRQLLAMVGIALSVALGVAVILWTRGPTYSVVYPGLTKEASNEMLAVLDAAGFDVKLEGANLVVPATVLDDAKMLLAKEGLPAESGTGMELLDRDPAFGLSQFMEKKRYHHALEIELGRTIAKLKQVRNARVHLASGDQSVFVRKRSETTASVVLDVQSGRSMDRDQVASIVHLVASSVPNLESQAVTVVDQFGQLLSSPDDVRDGAMSDWQFERTRKLESHYVQRIEALLAPVVGFGRVRAQVVADLDFTVSEQTEESFDQANSAVRSEQSASTQKRGGEADGGIPGALSNQPPVTGRDAAATAAAGAQGNAADGSLNVSNNRVANYEVGRIVTTTKRPVGDVERLWVAVVVDDLQTVAENGDPVATPRTPEELAQITSLVREAVGFDDTRGDTIQVLNKSFQMMSTGDAPTALPFWQSPLFFDIVRQGLGILLVLIVIFKVLKPMAGGFVRASTASLPAPAYAALPSSGAPALAGGPTHGELPAPQKPSLDERVNAAKQVASQDPERVANIMKDWVGGENG